MELLPVASAAFQFAVDFACSADAQVPVAAFAELALAQVPAAVFAELALAQAPVAVFAALALPHVQPVAAEFAFAVDLAYPADAPLPVAVFAALVLPHVQPVVAELLFLVASVYLACAPILVATGLFSVDVVNFLSVDFLFVVDPLRSLEAAECQVV